jgi:hypothetical protein
LLEIAENKQEFDFIDEDVPDPFRSHTGGCPFEPRCKEKEKIEGGSENHICKQILPPLINPQNGSIVYNNTDPVPGENHLIRCWLYLKQMGFDDE